MLLCRPRILLYLTLIWVTNFCLAEKNSSRPTLPVEPETNPAVTEKVFENSKNKSAIRKRQEELLKKNWLIPMPKEEFERLSQRFKGFSLFDNDARPWVVPGVTLMTPTGYSAQWGDIFAGFSVNDRTRFGRIADAFAMIGFGLGNPLKWLGFEITLGFLNVKKLLNSGKGLTAKMAHTFSDGTSIAVGKIDFLQWPPNAADTTSSEYFAISRAFQLNYEPRAPFSLLVVSLGIGDGQFKSDEKFRNEEPGVGLFSSLALRIVEPMTLIANWNHNLHFASSIAPFRKIPIILTLGVLDTLKTQGDGLRYVVGISYSDSVFSRSFPFDWFKGSDL